MIFKNTFIYIVFFYISTKIKFKQNMNKKLKYTLIFSKTFICESVYRFCMLIGQ